MLVLTRKLQERIKIGDDVTITVLRVMGHAVRIGIEAPRSVRVIRAELPADDASAEDAAKESTGGEAERKASATSGEEKGHMALAESDSPPAASPLRIPQRRMINRCGAPPLRLACSHALADSGIMS